MEIVYHEYAHSQMAKALEVTRTFCEQNDCSYDFWENSVGGQGRGHYTGLTPTAPYRQMRLRLLVSQGRDQLLMLTRWCGLVAPLLQDAKHYRSNFSEGNYILIALSGNAFQYHYKSDGKVYCERHYFADKKFCIWSVDYERYAREDGEIDIRNVAHFVICGQEGGSPDWGYTPYMVEIVAGPFKSARKMDAKILELDPDANKRHEEWFQEYFQEYFGHSTAVHFGTD